MSQEGQARPYAFAEALPVNEVPTGTTVFVTGSSMSPARDFGLSLVASDSEPGEGKLLISTNRSPRQLLDRCERFAPGVDPATVGVIDCTDQATEDDPDGTRVDHVNPSDLTGIGMGFSSQFEAFADAGITRVRTGLFTVSTLLMYRDLRTVFRFLHVLTGRIRSVDGFGALALDPTAHDEQTVNTLTQLCDGRIEVREADGDWDGECRVRGLSDQPSGWQPFDFPG